MAPIREDLNQAGARTVMLSLDGSLRYVPWAALYDPDRERYLIEDFAFASYSEVSRNLLERERVLVPRVAGLGVEKQVERYPSLPAVRIELEGIVRRDASDRDGSFDGVILLNDEFRSGTLVDVLESGFPLVHVASHFVFNPGTDRDSFLVLGDGSHLSLADIREQDLSFDDVDLITLSACETAVGDEGDGTEVEGLGALVQSQGAGAVVATLWRVADESTALTMKRFYEALARPRSLTKAAALREAQLVLLGRRRFEPGRRGGVDEGGEPAREDFSHPFHWAPFILMGNWL